MNYAYQVGGSLRASAPSYVRRQADLDLCAALQAGELAYVLSARQMGKSSLRVRTMRTLQQRQWHCCVIDFTVFGTHDITLEQWCAALISELSLGFGLNFVVAEWWRSQSELAPMQRLYRFLDGVLLEQVLGPIVIFLDEIDCLAQLPFAVDDFFGLLAGLVDRHRHYPIEQRLTWALFGVTWPHVRSGDRARNPLFVGRSIELTGFATHEVYPLLDGLVGRIQAPQATLMAIMDWTGGQPFLTQKLCALAAQAGQSSVTGCLKLPPGTEAFWVEQLVKTHIVDNWEVQDHPEHLRTIRDQLLHGLADKSPMSSRVIESLRCYQQILKAPQRERSSPAHQWLQLSGLVDRRSGELQVKNLIYQAVFNATWVESTLAQLPLPDQPRSPTLQRQIQELQRVQKILLGIIVGLCWLLLTELLKK